MKKIFVILMLSALMFLTNCDKEPTSYQYVSDDGRVIATIHGIVQNAQSNERITNVIVKYSYNMKRRKHGST